MIGYMINPGLNVNKTFREQVEKCIYTIFGEITNLYSLWVVLQNGKNEYNYFNLISIIKKPFLLIAKLHSSNFLRYPFV